MKAGYKKDEYKDVEYKKWIEDAQKEISKKTVVDPENPHFNKEIAELLKDVKLTENRMICQRLKQEKSKGGIILAEQENPDYFNAYVYKVGPGKIDPATGKLVPIEVFPGYIVVCQARCYQPIFIGGKNHELVILKTGDIVWYRDDGKISEIF